MPPPNVATQSPIPANTPKPLQMDVTVATASSDFSSLSVDVNAVDDVSPAEEEDAANSPNKRKAVELDGAAEDEPAVEGTVAEEEADVPEEEPTFVLCQPSGKSSIYWKEYMCFDIAQHPDKVDYAACKLCFKNGRYFQGTLSVKGGTTTGLKRHLEYHHPKQFAAIEQAGRAKKKQFQPMIDSIFSKKSELSVQQKHHLFGMAATDWVIDTGMPFSAVEKLSFRRMFDVVDRSSSKIVNITRKTVRSNIQMVGRYARGALELALSGQHVSWTTDHWTGPNDETYTTTTGHLITKNWQAVNLCLDFKVFEGKTTGARICEDMEDVLRKTGVLQNAEDHCVLAVKPMGVTDTTGNMVVLGRELRESLQSDNEHGFCVDHLFHLTAKKAFNCKCCLLLNKSSQWHSQHSFPFCFRH